MEENNYYPFGLKHENYNAQKLKLERSDDGVSIVLRPTVRNIYQYKYQGQERQDELGLNWDSFKYRNYDYAIGRFMSIDPLTEEYNTWSPYTFSGNRVIDARELEGLEPHSVHSSLQEAARNFATEYNGYSIRQDIEIATQFYKGKNENGPYYSYATPVTGTEGYSPPEQANDFPQGTEMVGNGHTHGNDNNFNVLQSNEGSGNPLINPTDKNLSNIGDYTIQNGSNAPSGGDKDTFNNLAKEKNYISSYVVTPSGLVYSAKKNEKTGKVEISINYNLSKTTPSDPNSNLRMNEVSPECDPQVLPKQGIISQN